jgi:integrase
MVRYMAAKLNNLTVPRLGQGNHCDGDGLYLRVVGASRTFAFRYSRGGKTHWLSLGRTADYTLAEARQKARECRRKLHEGVDLAAERKAARVIPPPGKTFGDVAEEYITAFESGWKPKQAKLWRATLKQHAAALLTVSVAGVGVHHVMAVMDPIWRTKNETASKLRGRIEAILTYARAKEYRHGDNPAEWRGRLKALLPERSDVATVVHRAALPWQEMPTTMARLAKSDGVSARCLAFTVLTAVRPGEAREARWSEIDFPGTTWTLPPSKIRSARSRRAAFISARIASAAGAT